MKYTINSNETFFEIDLLDFISKYNTINTKIYKSYWKIKTKDKVNSYIEDMEKILVSSIIKINKKKSKSSLSAIKIFWKIINKKDWFYLVFSTTDNNKKYTYTIKLISRLTFTSSWILACKKYNIEIDDLENKKLLSSINYWMNNPVISSLWINMSFNWLIIFGVIFSSFIYSVNEVFTFFAI